MLLSLIFILLAYLLGSFSSAIVLCQLAGLPDPRLQGSCNPGASNVLRLGGRNLASLVLLGDTFKGWFPVVLAKYLGVPEPMWGWVVFFAFLGHLFPIFFGFRGGKGVATALGGLLALAWPIGLVALFSWLLALCLFCYISLASIVAAVLTALYAFFVLPLSSFLPILLMSILLLIRHHANFKRLLNRKEPKLSLMNKNK